jgi:DNA-binding NtrC family response regulator
VATVLVVDHEQIVRNVVRAALARAGHEVLEARTAQEAFDIARQHLPRIDVLITNAHLPDAEGVSIARQFEGLRPGLNIMQICGHPKCPIAHEPGFESQAMFLQKPFKASDLVNVVHQMLSRPGTASGGAGAASD